MFLYYEPSHHEFTKKISPLLVQNWVIHVRANMCSIITIIIFLTIGLNLTNCTFLESVDQSWSSNAIEFITALTAEGHIESWKRVSFPINITQISNYNNLSPLNVKQSKNYNNWLPPHGNWVSRASNYLNIRRYRSFIYDVSNSILRGCRSNLTALCSKCIGYYK